MVVLDSKKSDALRCNYIKNFVDTVSTYYKENIESKTMFSDGLCYTGYLWDCLLNPSIILEKKPSNSYKKNEKSLLCGIYIHVIESLSLIIGSSLKQRFFTQMLGWKHLRMTCQKMYMCSTIHLVGVLFILMKRM